MQRHTGSTSPRKGWWCKWALPVLVCLTLALRPGCDICTHHSVASMDAVNVLRRRPCRVLIENNYCFHEETLESVMTKIPAEWILAPDDDDDYLQCNQQELVYDFGLGCLISGRMLFWVSYFRKFAQAQNSLMSERPTDGYDLDGDNRTVAKPKRIAGQVVIPKLVHSFWRYPRGLDDYDIVIRATCYCRPSDLDWMMASSNRYCVLHNHCPESVNMSRAFSVNPYNPRFYLPTALPGTLTGRSVESVGRQHRPPYQLCTIGNTKRRNFEYINAFLEAPRAKPYLAKMNVRILGEGPFPEMLNTTFLRQYVDHPRPKLSFIKFQKEIQSECDVILMLLDTKTHNPYFYNKLSGAVVSAAAYNIPAVIHEELASSYHQYLPDVYHTHKDSYESFIDALLQMMDHLSKIMEGSTPS